MAGPVIAPEHVETLKGAARVLAPVLATYHAALVEAGFSRDEALTFVAGFQVGMIQLGAASRGTSAPRAGS